MEITQTSISRRNLLRGAAATALLLPFGMSLASCAAPGGGGGGGGPKGEVTADNPFGVARTIADRGDTPPMYISANIPGGDEHNSVLEDRYRGRIRRGA